MFASRKKFSTPNREPRQNQLIRINHSRRIHLPGDSSNRLVAQGAAPFAGPEAFFRFAPADQLRKSHGQISSALSAVAQNRVCNSRRISTSVLKDLNVPGINTYRNRPSDRDGSSRAAIRSEGTQVWAHTRRPAERPRYEPWWHRRSCLCWGGRSGRAARVSSEMLSRVECALTQKGGGGYRRERLSREKATYRMRFSRSKSQELRGVKKVTAWRAGQANHCNRGRGGVCCRHGRRMGRRST